jgi:RNA polymerase sigma-70 factor (ECF subfamily)
LDEGLVPTLSNSASGLSLDDLRKLTTIDSLPEGEREAFDLVRIQGLS